VTSKTPSDQGRADAETAYNHLKRTLAQCREQLDRIEEMLTQSKQDNDPRK
jgi:hypothetical protein